MKSIILFITSIIILLLSETNCLICTGGADNLSCILGSITGCTAFDSTNTLGFCNTSNCGCLSCSTTYDLDANNLCVTCSSIITQCISCANITISPVCTQCNTSYVYNSTTSQCEICQSHFPGCYDCNNTVCIACHWTFYFNITTQSCHWCPLTLPPLCFLCSSSTYCDVCVQFYGFNSTHDCVLCANYLGNCSECFEITKCKVCVNISNYVLMNYSQCIHCRDAITFCSYCQAYNICKNCNQSYLGVNYTSNPDTCVMCNATIPNCIYCINYTFCLGCLNQTYTLSYIDPLNQVCKPCSDYLFGCSTCSNAAICLTCISNHLYLYNSSSQKCVLCSNYIAYCVKCTASFHCQACKDHRYALTQTLICQPCTIYLVSCVYCTSVSTCTLCGQGKMLPDKSGCSKTQGCVKVYPLTPVSINCISCDNTSFIETPVDGECICLKGWGIGSYCTQVIGCTGLIMVNGYSQCISCDTTKQFLLKSKTCECIQYYNLTTTKICKQICGDGYVIDYACDDGNYLDEDGCSSTCQIEPLHVCSNDNNRYPSSKCQFRAKVEISLSYIQKTLGKGKAKLIFDISPYSIKILQMNLLNLVTLDTYGCSVNNVQIINKQLVVYLQFNQTIDYENATLTMDFDHQYVVSPKDKVNFLMIESNGVSLNYDEQFEFTKTCESIVFFLSIISLAIFALGSFAFKMIGVQMLYSIQIVLTVQASSKHYTSFFANFQKMHVIYGQISSFSNSEGEQVSSNFSKLGFKVDLSENILFLSIINCSIILLYLIGIIYREFLKSGIQELEKDFEKQKARTIKKDNKKNEELIQKLDKLISLYYNWILFPILLGFLMHLIHTIFANSVGSFNKTAKYYQCLCILLSFIATALVFHAQIIGKYNQNQNILKENDKSIYIPYFLVHNLSLFLQLTFFLLQNIQVFYFIAFGSVIAHTVYLITKRPYVNNFSNFSIIFNQFVILFGFIWVFIKDKGIDSYKITQLLVYMFFGLISTINGLSLIRSILALKQKYWNTQSSQKNKILPLSQTRPKSPNKQRQEVDFTRLKLEQDSFFTTMLSNPKQNYNEIYQKNPMLSRERYKMLNLIKQTKKKPPQTKVIQNLFQKK